MNDIQVQDWRLSLHYNTTQRMIEQIEFNKKDAKERKRIYKEYCDQPTRYFVADFECTTKPPYSVYLATMKEIGIGETLVFYNIDDFLDYFADMRKAVVWFHNGEHYDFEFIRYAAYKLGVPIRNERGLSLHYKQPMQEVDKRNGAMKIDKKHHDYIPVESEIAFLDSMSIVKSSIKAIGEMLDLHKGMDKVETPIVHYIHSNTNWVHSTGEEGTKQYQIHKMKSSFKQALIDKRWTEYAIRDTEILEALAIEYDFIKLYEDKRLTIAKIAFTEMLEHCPSYDQSRYDFAKAMKGDEDGQYELSVLNKVAKNAYKGGLAWTNPAYAGVLQTTEHGYHLDYTSMYPSIYGRPDLYPLPYFMPTNKKTDLYIIHFDYVKAVAKDKCFHLLKTRTDVKGPNSNYYLPKFEGPLSITSVEHQYMKDCYDILEVGDYEVIYYERHYELEKALSTHLAYWYHIKETAKGALRAYAKLMLNAVYGYLGFFNSPKMQYNYVYDKDEDMVIKEPRDKKAYVGLKYPEIPAAAFITAYGRVKLARDINAIGIDHVVCCDTDSLFIIDLDYETIKSRVSISDKLGDFKLEHEFNQIMSIKPKTYAISKWDGKVTAQATAGSNYKFKKIESFVTGLEYRSLETVRGPGGVGLEYVKKKLGEYDYNETDGYVI